MDTSTLSAFLAVAEHGSFSQAAARLFLTQPAVSKRVAALEEELGLPLFERLGRTVLLTEAGRALLPRARHIVEEMAASRRLIADLDAEVGGVLELVTSHHLGLHRLPGILRRFSRQYPKVELDLQFRDSESGWAAVASGKRELAVVTLPRQQACTLAVEKVWDDPLAVMVARDHPLASGADGLAGLLETPAIVPETGTETRRLIEAPFHAAGLTLHTGVVTNYLETIRMLVAVGLGWGVLPLSMYSGELAVVEIPGVAFFRELGVVCRRREGLSRAARAFWKLLSES